ncbi:APC family permease [Paenibacillus paeoniae]|uniref:APC family permease n=1 Tax=Paenibacillus paeoniae TaxID=2292705 RepID=UPI0014040C26|nr:amino acid permease [Paenibacillus paeoniae]
MKQNKMGPLALSGFIIGPILGSGIFILPPIVYGIAGDWAIAAWAFIIVISFIVALIFGFLSIQFPGDGGATNAIEHVFGVYVKRLAAFYLIIGVTFGASAVLLTAGQYIEKLNIASDLTVSYLLLPVCILFLLARINLVGKIAFGMSIIAALVLFLGGAKSLLDAPKTLVIASSFSPSDFSYALLILFWAVFGWEIIGNYSADVIHPKQTITKAILISITAISIVNLVVAAAIQWADFSEVWSGELTITAIVYSLFGNASNLIMAIIALFLCCSTYFLYVGGLSRLIASLAADHVLPKLLGRRSRHNVPVIAVFAVFLLNLAVLLLVQAGVFDLENLVAFANSFLTMNALIGIGAGVVLIQNRFLKGSGIALAVAFILMLIFHSSMIVLILIGALAIYYGVRQVAVNREVKWRSKAEER